MLSPIEMSALMQTNCWSEQIPISRQQAFAGNAFSTR
jgi:hypothetical protein